MRELGFAIVGATALIVLGLWSLGRSDNQEWSDAAHINQYKSSESVDGPSARNSAMIAPDNVRLTNTGGAPE